MALPLTCASIAGLIVLVIGLGMTPTGDAPSHLFQTWLYRHAGFNLWNNYWYAGRYEFVTYSVLYYPLASLIGQALATTIAAQAAPARNGYIPEIITIAGAVAANAMLGPRAAGRPKARWLISAKLPHSVAAETSSTAIWPNQAASG
jgi:hypothetical protein